MCVYICFTAREEITQGENLTLKEVSHKRGTLWVLICLSW